MLINGGGGGSGSFAIQLAKQAGAHVTAVDNAGKLDFMRSLGADEVIDYARDDFTRTAQPYDLILDLVAHRSVFAYRRALAAAAGTAVWAGRSARCCGCSLRAPWSAWPVGRSIGVLVVKEGPEHFEPLAELCATGTCGSTWIGRSRSARRRLRWGTSGRGGRWGRSWLLRREKAAAGESPLR